MPGMPRIRDPHTGRFTNTRHITKTAPVAKAAPPPAELRNELGVSVTHHVGKALYDDYLPQLRGRKAARVWREMADGDATVGGLLFGVESLVRELAWFAEPADDTPAAQQAADFLDSCLDDMTHTWGDHIAAALSFLPFGFSAFEIVYRQRTETEGSKYSDGMWGWRKLAYRPQDTIDGFSLDEQGGTQGISQSTFGRTVDIPIEKLVVYRTTSQRGPYGRSILRNAYKSWFYMRRVEELLAIGVDRDLAGLPVGLMPAESIIARDTAYGVMKDIVTRVKRDEQEGILLPSDRDETGNLLYDFKLLTAGGGAERLAGVLAIKRAFAQDILGSVLADFMGLGRDATGSRALADPKIELWQKSLEWVADTIAETLTRHAVPRLMALNGVPRALSPTLAHSPVKQTDVAGLATALKDIAGAGVPIVGADDPMLVAHLRDLLELPALEDDGRG